MKSSPALKWFLLLLLPITLGVKLAVHAGAELGDDKQVQLKVADFLVRQHFNVVSFEKFDEGRPMIRATAGACRVLVAKSPAIGSDRDVLQQLVTPTDRFLSSTDQPTWLTVSDFLWARLRREIGLNTQAAPVLAVIAAANCGAERLSWDELG